MSAHRSFGRTLALAAAAVAVAVPSTAIAVMDAGQPAPGGPAPPVASEILASGQLLRDAHARDQGIRFRARRKTEVHVQRSTYPPGASSGWHHHPGFAMVTVHSGQLTLYRADCRPLTLGPGQTEVESGRYTLARNESRAETRVYVTFVLPPRAPRIIPASPPSSCPIS